MQHRPTRLCGQDETSATLHKFHKCKVSSVTKTSPPQIRSARVGIIGSGFAGLALAIRLRQQGDSDFIVLEKGDAIGGTWRDNTYPGCACDVPSNLYSYSFAPNPEWSTTFAHQPEIRDYTERVARDHDLHRSVHLNTEATSARWDAEAQRWRVSTPNGEYDFQVLCGAPGPLSVPLVPNIPGLKDFDGPVMHSAQWDHDLDLTGKRVAVIGTGASAIQFVPQLQKIVGELKLFQRTPAWTLPRAEFKTSARRRALFRRFPILQKAGRQGLYWYHETHALAFTRRPELLRLAQGLAVQHLRRSVKDPELRRKLRPDYTMGCKRILLSNDYWPSLDQPNVEVLTTGVAGVEGNTVIGSDGERREVDAIVLGTGFHVTDVKLAQGIIGADGRTMAEHWDGSMQAYKGATVPGFPNFFFLLGPNTGLGHSSMIYMAEAAAQYVVDALGQMKQAKLASVDVRPERARRWNDGLQGRMPQTIWLKGNCASWYLDDSGRNTTLWPDFTFRFRSLTKRFDLESYTTLPARAAQQPAAAAVTSRDADDATRPDAEPVS